MGQQLERAFSGQGIKTLTGSRVTAVEKRAGGAVLSVETPDGSREFEVQRVLVAVGVQGNVEGLGLEELGVRVERGFVQVDDRMRTDAPGVYAIGDVTGRLLLAHVAQAQGVLAVETIAGVDSRTLDYRMMPRAVYCQPQVTGFGYTEREAADAGFATKVGRFPFRANGKSLAAGDSDGMVKVVSDGDTGEILGAHMIGAEVTEMLPELAMTNLLEGSVSELGWLVHSHPTLSEAIKEAALDAEGAAIHM